jgi:hypothetical protein
MLNVSEVLTILEKEGLTNSRQVVLRWIRQGNLPAVQESRKIGYQIEQSDLANFIAKKKESAASTQPTEQTSDDYRAGYQAAIKDLLDKLRSRISFTPSDGRHRRTSSMSILWEIIIN